MSLLQQYLLPRRVVGRLPVRCVVPKLGRACTATLSNSGCFTHMCSSANNPGLAGKSRTGKALVNLLGDGGKLGDIMTFLTMTRDPGMHYRKFAALRNSPQALQRHVDNILEMSAGDRLPGYKDDPSLSEQENAEKCLNEFRDRFGSQLARFEDVRQGVACQGAKGGAVGVFKAMAATLFEAQEAAAKADEGTWWNWASGADSYSAEVTKYGQLAGYSKRASNAGVVLTVGYFGYAFYTSVRKYWKCEIDGVQCAQNLCEAVATPVAGFFGGTAGMALVSGAGPYGVAFGAFAGSVIASGLASGGVRFIFQGLFGSDRDRALDNAYEILDLPKAASAEEVRKKYLKLVMEHHPDKGGNQERFRREGLHV